MRKAPTPWRRLEKTVEYFTPQQKIFIGYLGNSGCKARIPHFKCHPSTKLLNDKSNGSKAKLPHLSLFPTQRSSMADYRGFMEVKWSTFSLWRKNSIKTKKESIALETYILLKKKRAKWSKYSNLLISYYLLLQPEVSECSNTCICHKNFQVLNRKGILNKVGLAKSPLKIKKRKTTTKKTPTMLKHWNKVFKQFFEENYL